MQFRADACVFRDAKMKEVKRKEDEAKELQRKKQEEKFKNTKFRISTRKVMSRAPLIQKKVEVATNLEVTKKDDFTNYLNESHTSLKL